jgi:hypothetical protein
MTYEKPASKEIELRIVEFSPRPQSGLGLLIVIEMKKENEKTKFLLIKFSTEFIDDYFEIPGDESRPQFWKEILDQKQELFFMWAVAKAEDILEMGTKLEEIMITYEKDYEWAKKIEEGKLLLSSESKGKNIYKYVPEKRLGFK